MSSACSSGTPARAASAMNSSCFWVAFDCGFEAADEDCIGAVKHDLARRRALAADLEHARELVERVIPAQLPVSGENLDRRQLAGDTARRHRRQLARHRHLQQ